MRTQAGYGPSRALLATVTLFATLSAFSGAADAQRKERQGKEVVDAVCAACHASGKDKAPRIGDAKAWAERASQGLTALTAHALTGIRDMPAHGGNSGVSDIEIERAITYMVNRSGSSRSVVQRRRYCAAARRSSRTNAPSATSPGRTARRRSATARRGFPAWRRVSTPWWPRPSTATVRCRPAADWRT